MSTEFHYDVFPGRRAKDKAELLSPAERQQFKAEFRRQKEELELQSYIFNLRLPGCRITESPQLKPET